MNKKLVGACIIGQSGGPSSVINSSVLGAIKTALNAKEITRVYGANHGIVGVLNEELIDLELEDINELDLLRFTPSSALGSCRHKLKDPNVDDSEYLKILETFKKYDVRYFFYNGGNDSMDTCNKISKFCLEHGYECNVIGIPKTIDNDLYGTDHCPGYASSAKYIATSLMEIYLDTNVYDYGNITVVEIMGRNAGWLAGASCLAQISGFGPDLIYLPEVPFILEDFVDQVYEVYKKRGKALIAVSEGIKDLDGVYVSEYGQQGKEKDNFGHVQMGGLATYLAQIIKVKTGAKVRGIELSLLQRCSAHIASKTDYDEAYMAGETAVVAAINGETDKMVGFECSRENGYTCKTKLVPLSEVANVEVKVPTAWINETHNGVTQDFIDYLLPLIQGETELPKENGLPRFAKLKKILVDKK